MPIAKDLEREREGIVSRRAFLQRKIANGLTIAAPMSIVSIGAILCGAGHHRQLKSKRRTFDEACGAKEYTTDVISPTLV